MQQASQRAKPAPQNHAALKLSKQKRAALNAKLAELAELKAKRKRAAFEQKRRKKAPKPARIVAYDFETESIGPGTPRPLYLTAHGADFSVDTPIRDAEHLAQILETYFLTDEMRGVKYVAWAGNRFDAYFVAMALVVTGRYVLRPYLTGSHSLRGLQVRRIDDGEKATGWEFLCGMAMTGLEGLPLSKFLANFAPEWGKLTGVIDFDAEQFDPSNARHREYAYRDSEGLYHGRERAQAIMLEHFDQQLTVTMGGACIRIFQAHIPLGVQVLALEREPERVFREFVMRGGYCYCARRHAGPIWKYDINQAYAAAMRESPLPCGAIIHNKNGISAGPLIYVARIKATNPKNRIPFYYRTEVNGRIRSQFATTEIRETWLTSLEILQLRAEGWAIRVFESYIWSGTFTMRDYVDRLERLRTTCEGGPGGPIGTMVKAVGNHSYGKTVEEIPPLEYVLASECPESYAPYFGDGFEPIQHVFFKFADDAPVKDYHAVQIGAFITASVRMKVRRAALLDPGAWLYADTDCVIFSRDVTDRLEIDAKRYGAWKIEETGAPFRVIAKKVYAEITPDDEKPKKRSAKGLNVKKLTGEDFRRWYDGTPPVQNQTQRNNFLSVMQGAEMFRSQIRRGTATTTAPKRR